LRGNTGLSAADVAFSVVVSTVAIFSPELIFSAVVVIFANHPRISDFIF
jgi:hypothetical protein